MNDSADSDKARTGSAQHGMTPADILFWGCVILLLSAMCVSAAAVVLNPSIGSIMGESKVQGVFFFAITEPLSTETPHLRQAWQRVDSGFVILEKRMINNRLLFRGYASHELNEISNAFRIKTGQEPSAFVIRPDFVVSGSKENHEKIVMSRTCANNCVMVPYELTKAELEYIYSNISEYRSIRRKEAEAEITSGWDEDLTRYCMYCGQVFVVVSLNSKQIICGKPECSQREKDRLNGKDIIKQVYPHEAAADKPKAEIPKPDTESKPETKMELIDKITDDDDLFFGTVTGYVYLIEADNGLCKIGHTDNVLKRFSDLAAMNAAGLSLRHAIHAKNRMRAEKWLHGQFSNKRSHNEWFRLTNEDIAWIMELHDGALDTV